jgi:dTDP-4-amino-4,6-dideoxygalactose transaminase
MNKERIPFSPPHIDQKTIDAVTEVLKSGWITTGPKTRALEKGISDYVKANNVICLNSWTNACELMLRWWGVGPGDEVLVPAYTYAATANIVHHVGAKAILVDSCLENPMINAACIEPLLSSKTKVVMPVDIGGMPVDYDGIMNLLKTRQVSASNSRQETLQRPLFLSDAAHSFGGTFNKKRIGSQADVSGFSFHAVKNLTTAEGGALVLNLPEGFDNAELWKDMNRMSLHGQSKDAMAKTQGTDWRYDILEHGFKCNMTDIHAAIGLVELERYQETLDWRKKCCELYTKHFENEAWFIPPVFKTDTAESSYHLYMLRVQGISERQRDEIIHLVQTEGVAVNVHFQPLPLLTAFKQQGWSVDNFPNAMRHYQNEISLPVFMGITDQQIERVADTIKSAISSLLK